MSVASGIVLFAVIWFMVLFITLPFGLRTQDEDGKVEPGTNPGSPVNFNLKRTALIVTGISVVVWAIIAAIIISDVIRISELGWI